MRAISLHARQGWIESGGEVEMAIREIEGLGTVDIIKPYPLNDHVFHVAVGTSVVEIDLNRETGFVSGRTRAGTAEAWHVAACMREHYRRLKGIKAPVVDTAANRAFEEAMCADLDKDNERRKRLTLTRRAAF